MNFILVVILISAMSVLRSHAGTVKPKTNSTKKEISMIFNMTEFMSILPKDALNAIIESHATNDSGFRAAIKYLQGKEWNERIAIIKQKPEWIKFKGYLMDAGINVDTAVECDFLNKIHIEGNVSITDVKDLKPFMLDLMQIVPTYKMLSFINEKFIHTDTFKVLYEKLSTETFHKIVEDLRALPEVQQVINSLKEMGIDLNVMLSFIYTLFGWK